MIDESRRSHARLVVPSISSCPFHPLNETAHSEFCETNVEHCLIVSSRLGPPATG